MARQLASLIRFVSKTATQVGNASYEAQSCRYFIDYLRRHADEPVLIKHALHEFAEEHGF